jgi:cytochrome c oxidase cbb3-type subunit 1
VQYSMYVIGFIFFFTGFTLTGLVQGSAWLHQGVPVWSILPGLVPYMALRAMGGALIVTSIIIFAYNIFATVLKPRAVVEPTLSDQPAAASAVSV